MKLLAYRYGLWNETGSRQAWESFGSPGTRTRIFLLARPWSMCRVRLCYPLHQPPSQRLQSWNSTVTVIHLGLHRSHLVVCVAAATILRSSQSPSPTVSLCTVMRCDWSTFLTIETNPIQHKHFTNTVFTMLLLVCLNHQGIHDYIKVVD